MDSGLRTEPKDESLRGWLSFNYLFNLLFIYLYSIRPGLSLDFLDSIQYVRLSLSIPRISDPRIPSPRFIYLFMSLHQERERESSKEKIM